MRAERYRRELEEYLRAVVVDGYAERVGAAWRWDHSDLAAYARSVEPNRRRWAALLGAEAVAPGGEPAAGAARRGAEAVAFEGELEGEPAARPHPLRDGLHTEWVRVPLQGGLAAEGLLALPDADGPVPLAIVQHGLRGRPEQVFGAADPGERYHDCGGALVQQGFAVLAPLNLEGADERNRLQRLVALVGGLVEGVELARFRRLLDAVLQRDEIDAGRVGMWGLSWGGLAALYWMPLEPRVHVGVVSGYFNERRSKLAVPDDRYTCFLDTPETHAHHAGLLTEFADAELASLICPRPLLVQHGRGDDIAWPEAVAAEHERAREHWERLGLAEHMELDLHDGGHELRLETGVRWLARWLLRSGPKLEGSDDESAPPR